MERDAPLRRITLRLAVLSRQDRQWILEQLDHNERNQVLALLDEINQLGLLTNPGVVSDLLRDQIEQITPTGLPLVHPVWGALLSASRGFSEQSDNEQLQEWLARLRGIELPVSLLNSLERRISSGGIVP